MSCLVLHAGDRFSYLVLLGSLVLLDKDPRHSHIFGGMLALDMSESRGIVFVYMCVFLVLASTAVNG